MYTIKYFLDVSLFLPNNLKDNLKYNIHNVHKRMKDMLQRCIVCRLNLDPKEET